MTETMDRRFELTTSLTFPMIGPVALAGLAERLDAGVYEASRAHPTITAYFVAIDEVAGGLQVGLRFEGMDPRYIEGTADDVIDDAVAHAAGEQSLRPVREESSLVPA
ncbi:hypothetical protein [Microbacterium sp. Leaf151]|uniref:hypothetical protein n=1 Tax=Microbacterium sp. Leaf151 TaxID=1736276 RepID=UPI0006F958AA|nr:hypothetical protein [Microbacterium sp. Leaf151]KQR21703.1 hypothetical protein ASF76_15960 [Microbacterium sp. Leaf151]